MPVLADAQHECFAQEVAKGSSAVDAYEAAGYSRNDSNSARLRNRSEVTARIQEILSRAAKRAEITAADIANQLDEDREFARKHTAPAAAVSATMGKAKVLGLIVDRLGGPDGNATRIVHEIDLSKLTPEQQAAIASISLADE